MKDKYIECGRITNTHGVAGAMRAEAWTDSPSVFTSLKKLFFCDNGAYTEYKVISSSPHKAAILLKLEGISTIEEAARFKTRTLYALRSDIPFEEGKVFIVDLIGLPVIDIDSGVKYGVITDVINTGASDIYEIKTENGMALMPVVDEFVKKVDIEEAVYVRPIEGMF